jgi:hypothetical protein
MQRPPEGGLHSLTLWGQGIYIMYTIMLASCQPGHGSLNRRVSPVSPYQWAGHNSFVRYDTPSGA